MPQGITIRWRRRGGGDVLVQRRPIRISSKVITGWIGIVWSTENALINTDAPLGSPRVAAFSRGLLVNLASF